MKMYEESWLDILQDIGVWIYQNYPLLIGSGMISALVSGLIGHFTRKRLVVRAERKDHLKQIQTEAIQSMINTLESLPSRFVDNLDGMNPPREMSLERPTSSRLFDVVEIHFLELWKEWKVLDKQLIEDTHIAITFYEKIRQELVKQTGLKFEGEKNTPQLHWLFPEWIFAKFSQESADLSGLKSMEIKPDKASNIFELKAEGWTLALGSKDAMEKCMFATPKALMSLKTVNPDFKAMRKKFFEQVKKTTELALDALAQTRLKGKCRFCP